MRFGLICSLILHGLLIALLISVHNHHGSGNSKDGKQASEKEQGEGNTNKDKDGDFTQNGKDKEAKEVKKDDGVEITIIEKPKKKEEEEALPCDEKFTYGGVGLQQDYSAMVIKAPPYYPAYKAGIREGDYIINPLDEIRGEPGTIAHIIVNRLGNTIDFYVTRAKICYIDKENNPNGP